MNGLKEATWASSPTAQMAKYGSPPGDTMTFKKAAVNTVLDIWVIIFHSFLSSAVVRALDTVRETTFPMGSLKSVRAAETPG